MVSDQAAPHNIPSAIAEFPDPVVPAGMVREQFHAMGTTVTLLLPEEHLGNGLVQELFAAWEQTLSRFLPESELSRLNAHTGQPVFVGKLLYTVLEASLAAARATGGIYDPTLLDQLMRLGYDRTFDDLSPAQPGTLYDGRPGGGWRAIQVNRTARCVVLPVGVKLDFGGIAKGMAVDAALKVLQSAGVASALVNAGGDLAVLGLPPHNEDWLISLPLKDELRTVPLHHGTMATSGIARRHWSQGASQRHHLLDPRNGLPASSGLWSVTVVAARCEQAEVAAKVAFVLGVEEGSAFLQRHQLPGLLVASDGTWRTAGPWPKQFLRQTV